ncbi:hypothetical protein ACFW04_011650 [Cataglyphis niger]
MRIEESRDLVPVADEDILRCLPFFSSGIALYWFRERRDRLPTWAAFRSAWRTRFGDPDFQFALRDEIIRRIAEQVSYAFRNMLPRLQIAMRRDKVNDLDALEDVAIRIEASHQLAQRYRAPPTPDKSLFPDLVYRSPRHVNKPAHKHDTIAALNISSSSVESGDHAAKTLTDRSVTSSTASTIYRCWNCDDIGHLSRNCEGAPRMHRCYRCGRTEVTLRTCPDCSRKE